MSEVICNGKKRYGWEEKGWAVTRAQAFLSAMFLHRTLSIWKLLYSNFIFQIVIKVYAPRSTDKIYFTEQFVSLSYNFQVF